VPTQIFGTSSNVLISRPSFCFAVGRISPVWDDVREGGGWVRVGEVGVFSFCANGRIWNE
jgi:hypothetical protein